MNDKRNYQCDECGAHFTAAEFLAHTHKDDNRRGPVVPQTCGAVMPPGYGERCQLQRGHLGPHDSTPF